MKIFTTEELRQLDQYTIAHESIKSIDLMERSAVALTQAISGQWSIGTKIVVFAGPGNNGGDALAVARLLSLKKYSCKVYLFNIRQNLSTDCETNRDRLQKCDNVEFFEIINEFEPPQLDGCLVIDGLFGTGLTKTLTGGFSSLVKYINASKCEVVSIDIPSGLISEDNTLNVDVNIIKADYTFTLHQKKLAFLFSDNQEYIGKLKVLDIGLSKQGIQEIPTPYYLLESNDITSIIKSRSDFAHKGDMGHALIMAGKYGMGGAAILATKAALRSGAGKITTTAPRKNNDLLQISVPEAIVALDKDECIITQPVENATFNAIGVGPGLGQDETTAVAVISQIRRNNTIPCVIDADAINIIASHRAWLMQLPKGIILTPHPKELERLMGNSVGCYEELSKARELAHNLQGYIILKGHYSALCTPDNKVYFNSTGNSGMATAGSGDVLTGIIVGLLARGYNQEEACKLGMYVHGLAGDLAAAQLGKESLIASDIIEFLPKAFQKLS